MRKRRYERDQHLLYLVTLPEYVRLFALSEHVLQVLALFNVLTDDAYTVGVVHRLVEEVAIELNDVLVVLSLEQLHCFLLYTYTRFELEMNQRGVRLAPATYLILIELVERFGLNLLEGVVAARGNMEHLVDLGVLLAVAQQVHFLKVLLSEHLASESVTIYSNLN